MSKSTSRVLRRIVLAAIFALAASIVHAQDVGYNAMPGTDFTKYKTYKWVKIQGVAYPNDITNAQLQQAIDAQLATKGLTKTEDENADLYVGYQIAVDKETQWNAYGMGGSPGWGWGPGYRGYGYGGGGMATATSTTIHVGMLGLDIYDHAAKQLVWRGTATKTLDTGAKPDKRAKNIDKGVKKLLKNYPPPVKK